MERISVRGANRLVGKMVSCTVVGRGRKNGSRKSCVVARRFHHYVLHALCFFVLVISSFSFLQKFKFKKRPFVIFSFQKIVAQICDR
jgi:hypothetical protein